MNIEKYEILGKLGEKGGMSDVLLGQDKQTGQQVVVKFMKLPEDTASDHTMRRRFDWEVNIACTVNHPHILRAIGHGEAIHDGYVLPFLVYPYIAGGTLQKLLLRAEPWKHWTLPQIVDVIIQAAEGLYYLHTLTPAIVHHDVKPDNFLLKEVQEEGSDRKVHLWLSDFGISRWQQDESYQTRNIIGTQQYMAPEQLQGYISVMSDQYALALVTHYLLTGDPPKALAIDRNKRRLTELNPARLTSHEIDDVVLQALSKDPEQRFPNVLDFAHALRIAVMKQVGLDGFHDGPTELFTPRPPMSKTLQHPAQPETEVSSLFTLPVQTFSPQTPAPEAISLKEIPIRPVPPHSIIVDKPLPAQQSAHNVQQPSVNSLPVFSLQILFSKDVPALPNMLSWSPDGTQLVCTFYGQQPPWLIDMNGKVQVLQTLTSTNIMSWSPSGHLLAVSMPNQEHTESKICLWEREKPLPVPLCIHNTPTIDGLDWSSQGQLAVWVEPHILLYTLSMQATPVRFPSLPRVLKLEQPLLCGNLGTLRWSPDGSWLAAGTSDGALICWHTGNEQPSFHIPASGARIYSLAWSDDSIWLAAAFQNKHVGIWNMREMRQVRSWEKLPHIPQMLSISSREQVLVAGTRSKLLFGKLNDASPVTQYPGQMLAAWSPTGQKLATLDARSDTTIVVLQR